MLLLNPFKIDSCDVAAGESRRGAVTADDRRRGLRISQDRPIKVFEPMSARYFGGKTCDVSATGLKIELPASMPVREGKTISVHVGLSDQGQGLANRRSMIPAKVVWVERAGTGKVMAGVEFVASIAAHLDAA